MSAIETICIIINDGFGLRFQSSWLGILDTLKTLFIRLNHFADPILVSFHPTIDDLRFTPTFSHKEKKIDKVLSAAITTIGPRIFLTVLPLNIDNLEEGKRGRA